VVLKVGGITPLGTILRGKGGDETKRGDKEETTQRGKNAQPLLDR